MRAQAVAIHREQCLLFAMIGEKEWRGQQMEAVLAGPAIRRLGAHRRNPDRRGRTLHRSRAQRVAFNRGPASVMRHPILRPQRADDRQVLIEAFPALAHRHVGDVVVVLVQPAADAEIQPAMRQHIGHRIVLGGAHRIVQRQQTDRTAEPDALRLARAGGDEQRGRAEREAGDAMLGEPRAVEAECLRQLHLGDHVVVPVLPGTGEFLVVVGDIAETEFHRVSSALADATLAANAGTGPRRESMDFGIGIATSQRFVEARAARRGTGLHPCLVLRHADDHRRLLRRDGRRRR